MLLRDTSTVADAALGAVWHLLTIGLEYDGDFAIPRELILRSQRRVRQLRWDASPTSREVGSIAAGLALRARFDWERHGKRTGVQRALAYLRLASRERAHETLYATTLRVGFEAGLGDSYLQESLAVFERMRTRPGFRPNTPDDTNFASTLMLVATEERDPSRLLQAIELYEASIAREPDSATNVSRYINLASAARLFGARDAALSSSEPEAVARIAGFCLEAAGTPLVGFRNFQPVAAHELFNALRAEVETRQPGRRLLRHAARSLGAPLAPIHWPGSSGAARFLVAHSPTNGARPLSFGFTLTSRIRELGAEVVDLSLDDCRGDAITRHLPAADVVLVVSHGERGASDRILLAGDDYADASWLLGLGDALNGKCLFLVACNSGHFNARLTHDDIGLASLAIGLGARGVFSTLRSVDELSILLLVSAALESWRDGVPLGLALDSTRTTMLGLDAAGWGEATGDFVRPSPGAHSAARNPLDAGEPSRLAADRADVDVGWSFVLG